MTQGPNAARFRQTGQGTATATGTVTVPILGPCPAGSVMTGTVTITNAPPASQWSVLVSGSPIDTTSGSASCAGVQLEGGETLSLTGTGLAPGVTYQAIYTGIIDDAEYAEITVPGHDTVSTLSSPSFIGQAFASTLGTPTVTPTFSIPPGATALMASVSYVQGATGSGTLTVTGATSGYPVMNQALAPGTGPITTGYVFYGLLDLNDSAINVFLQAVGLSTSITVSFYAVFGGEIFIPSGPVTIVQQPFVATPNLAGILLGATVAGTKDTAVNIGFATVGPTTLTPSPPAGALYRVGTISGNAVGATTFTVTGAVSGNSYVRQALAAAGSFVVPFDAQVGELLQVGQSAAVQLNMTTYYREIAQVPNLI